MTNMFKNDVVIFTFGNNLNSMQCSVEARTMKDAMLEASKRMGVNVVNLMFINVS